MYATWDELDRSDTENYSDEEEESLVCFRVVRDEVINEI